MAGNHTSTETSDDVDLPPGVIAKLASEAKKYYAECRRLSHPHYKERDSSRWKSSWRHVAVFCFRKKVAVTDLIDAAFAVTRPFPHPNHLLSSVVIRRVTDPRYQAAERGKFLMQFNQELDELRQMAARNFTLEQILYHPAAQMSPLFRYTVAVNLGRPDIASDFRAEAENQRSFAADVYLELLDGRSALGEAVLQSVGDDE